MRQTIAKGFTLIELAIVIAIIAILAAVAIPRFADTTTSAECSLIRDMASQLTSAAAVYTAAQSTPPAGFDNYVTSATTVTGQYTTGISRFGPNASIAACGIAANAITCTANRFSKYTPVYTFNNGSVTFASTPVSGNANLCR